MKDFRKGFLVALSCIAFVCVSTLAVFAEETGESSQLVPGLSISFGTGFTSEFGGLGANIYKSEAGHEKVVQTLKASGMKASYSGDKGGSLVALIPELQVRYDVTRFFFVRLGYQGGVRLTGGQWSVDVNNIAAYASPTTGTFTVADYTNGQIDVANYGLWSAGIEQIGNNGRTTFNWKFSSHEIPFVLGLNVPVENGRFNAYAAMGVKYAWYIVEKTVHYSAKASNVGTTQWSTQADTHPVTGAPEAAIPATTAGLMAKDRTQAHYKYNLHGLAITWLIGVDAKIYENLGAYLEMEFTTNTDSKAKKQYGDSAGGWQGAVSSGTCRYYKLGVKYWL